jgi:anti-anti-sigma regulatory factor
MSQELAIRVVSSYPIAVVELQGPLDFAGAPALRGALREQIARQPDVIIVDLAGIAPACAAALSVLRAAVRVATDTLAGVPIVVLAPDPAMFTALRGTDLHRDVHVVERRHEAVSLAARQASPLRQVLRHVPCEPGSLREMRRAVTGACERWGASQMAPEAELVAGELVTNVIEHAQTPFDLTIALRERHLYLAVRDGSAEPPRRIGPNGPSTARGRGLLVVEDIAASWGSVAAPDGKIVWAMIPVKAPVVPPPPKPCLLRLVSPLGSGD